MAIDKRLTLSIIESFLPGETKPTGDLDGYTQYIESGLTDESLDTTFQHNGKFSSILAFLIQRHSQLKNLLDFIVATLERAPECHVTIGGDLHLALSNGLKDIVDVMFGQSFWKPVVAKKGEQEDDDIEIDPVGLQQETSLKTVIDYSARDLQGQTLLACAIHGRNMECLTLLVNNVVQIERHIDTPSYGRVDDATLLMTPVQQAIIAGCPDAVKLLVQTGANLQFTCGETERFSPVQLAVKHKHYPILSYLLLDKAQSLDLNGHAASEFSPMDMLCEQLHDDHILDKRLIIQSIAALLYHGGNAPEAPAFRNLLADHREVLMTEMLDYAETNHGQLDIVPAFVAKVHRKTDPLHDIFYGKRSLGDYANRLFCEISPVPQQIEKLVRSTKSDEEDCTNADLFAEFVEKYQKHCNESKTFLGIKLYNRNSTMRWELEQGHITTWEQVMTYARKHPDSRTGSIVMEMGQQNEANHQIAAL